MKGQTQMTVQEQMFQMIEEFQSSRKARKIFCSEKRMATSKFYYWQRKYREYHNGMPNGMFLSIKASGKDKWDENSAGEIMLQYPNGVLMYIPINIPVSMLRTLVSLI